MLKNIQKYLLLNYPLLWNIKLIPILFGAILGNILLFLFGYSIQYLDFTDYYSSYRDEYFLIYFFIAIVVILSLILWLVNYSKNNAVKSFYPTNLSKLYLEWILILISVFSVALLPYSFNRGTNYKLRSYATISELIYAEKVLKKVKILMPSSDSKMDYFQEIPTEESSRYYNYSMKGIQDTHLYDYNNNRIDSIFENNQQIYYPDYPDFTQFSLLNYSSTDYVNFIYSTDKHSLYRDNQEIVKEWLVEGKIDSIKQLMSEYLKLESSKHLPSNITVDQWFSQIYNPPTFKINESSLFEVPYSYYNTYNTSNSFFYYNLKSGYEEIANAYNSDGQVLFIVLLYLSLGVSMLIFSFRVTSGKAWLISMISIGLIALIFSFFTAFLGLVGFIGDNILNPFSSYGFLVIALFLVELFIIINRESKGKSDVLLDHVIGLLPIIPLIILVIVTNWMSNSYADYVYNNYYFLYINFVLTFITMFLLIKFVLIRWKGLPEE